MERLEGVDVSGCVVLAHQCSNIGARAISTVEMSHSDCVLVNLY